MPVAVVTGSGGLIGSESVRHFVEAGYDVIGIENDMRSAFFGPHASTRAVTERLLQRSLGVHLARPRRPRRRRRGAGVRAVRRADRAGGAHGGPAVARLGGFGPAGRLRRQRERDAQPAGVHAPPAPDASFVFTSTNKVYGDTPNRLPLVKLGLREIGSRYLFIVLYAFLEHHLSRGDYRRPQTVKRP